MLKWKKKKTSYPDFQADILILDKTSPQTLCLYSLPGASSVTHDGSTKARASLRRKVWLTWLSYVTEEVLARTGCPSGKNGGTGIEPGPTDATHQHCALRLFGARRAASLPCACFTPACRGVGSDVGWKPASRHCRMQIQAGYSVWTSRNWKLPVPRKVLCPLLLPVPVARPPSPGNRANRAHIQAAKCVVCVPGSALSPCDSRLDPCTSLPTCTLEVSRYLLFIMGVLNSSFSHGAGTVMATFYTQSHPPPLPPSC